MILYIYIYIYIYFYLYLCSIYILYLYIMIGQIHILWWEIMTIYVHSGMVYRCTILWMYLLLLCAMHFIHMLIHDAILHYLYAAWRMASVARINLHDSWHDKYRPQYALSCCRWQFDAVPSIYQKQMVSRESASVFEVVTAKWGNCSSFGNDELRNRSKLGPSLCMMQSLCMLQVWSTAIAG